MVNTVGYQHFENSVHKRPQQGGRDKMPRRVNVVAAASYVRKIFESKKLAYSIMGGFQMSCLGNGREVSSIQIAYDDRDFDRIKKKLEADQRIQLPGGMNPLTPTKILVQTGPWYKDAACTACATIEVYLLPPGSYGTPPSGTLKNNVILLSDNTGGVLRTFNGLNMLYLVKTLIQFCKSHDLGWSPLEDLLLLCQRYGGQIQAVRDQLDQIAIHQNFLNTPFFSRLPAEEQRRCFQILAGQILPSHPGMGTPSPQNSQPQSQSTLEVQKTRMSLYNNSAPRLNTTFAHGLPNTQLVHSEQPAQMHASKINLPWMNLPSSPREAEANIPSGDSRSRYRRISTCNVRRVTSGPQLSGNSSKESLHETYASQKTSPVNVPSLQQSHSHTQVSTKANALPTVLSIQQRDNVTKPGARNVGTGASSQAQSFKKDSTSRNPQQEHHSEAFEMPATPMQLKPIPEQREKEANAGRRSTANNIQSFQEKQTPNNFQVAQSNNQEQEEAPKKLHIVGPNGIYQAPPPLRTQKTKTIPDSTNEIYELDSSLSHPHSDSHDIIAELSADIISAVEQIGGPNTILTTTTTPASSDRRAVSAPLQTPSQPQQQPPIEFTPPSQQKQFHAVPAPSAALPPSLVPGGRHGHHHSNSTSSIVSTSSSLQEAVNLYARLNSGYATPPFSEADEDTDSSEQQLRDWVCAEEELSKTAPLSSSSPPLTPAPLAVYKAYRPSAQQSQSQSQPQSRSASASPPVPAGSGAAAEAKQVRNDAHGRRRYYSDMHVRESLQHDFRVTAQQEQHLSVDPNLLAMEYRAALPQFEQGYAS